MRKFLVGLAFGLYSTLLLAASAQDPSDESGVTTLHLSAQLVLLDAIVADHRTGFAITGLTADDFLLNDEGVPQSITYVSTDQLPLSIILLVDTTDSVQPVVKRLAQGAAEVLRHLRSEDEVAVFAFSSTIVPLQAFTLDRPSVVSAILNASKMHSRDPTFLHEDMFEANAFSMKSMPNSRRVEIWLTDGTANLQDPATQKRAGKNAPAVLHTMAEAEDALLHSGTAVNAVIEQSWEVQARSHVSSQAGHFGQFDRYIGITGGAAVNSSPQDVAAHLAVLIEALRQRYTLGFKPSKSRPTGTLCRLHLELSPGFYARHPVYDPKSVFIRTRAAYFR